jgi:hypothetical protein
MTLVALDELYDFGFRSIFRSRVRYFIRVLTRSLDWPKMRSNGFKGLQMHSDGFKWLQKPIESKKIQLEVKCGHCFHRFCAFDGVTTIKGNPPSV